MDVPELQITRLTPFRYSETYSYTIGYGNGGNGGNKVSLVSVTRVMDGHSYVTSYQSNAANQLTQMTYPSGRVINLGHDNKGRITSVGSYLSTVTYNGIGQLTGTTLGNGVTETYGYDANRMQLTSQTATQSGGPTNGLMNLTYGYQASAGQMGAGTTAGNAGQLMSISGTIGGVTESAAYTYDDLGRVVTSNQTSNTVSAQRRFAYDRWGNRTGMWDAVSGGTQIQSITLQQSGGAPTNRITGVTSGSTVNYSYDAAGNVTNDGMHSYGYDSENRIVSVDGGSAASYAYDNQNRRYKKTVGSTVTHYVWKGSQVLSEHNGSTGAVLIDYIYSGSRMIAKVVSGSTQYSLSDRLSVRLSLDSSGNVLGRQSHLPFGEDFGESGTQEKHHFTSYERDGESGLDYAINRIYLPTVGRFQSVDKKPGDAANPQRLNRYAYTRNNPLNRTDRLGLDDDDDDDDDYGEVIEYYPPYIDVDTPGLPSVIVEPGQGRNPWRHCLEQFQRATSKYKNSAAPTLDQFRTAAVAADAAGVDVAVMLTTWWLETSFSETPRNTTADNNRTYYGPLQLGISEAQKYLVGTGYTLGQVIGDQTARRFTGDLHANLTVGGRFLAQLVSEAGGDDALAVLRYMNPGLTSDQSKWSDADSDRYAKAHDVMKAFREAAQCIRDVDQRIFNQ